MGKKTAKAEPEVVANPAEPVNPAATTPQSPAPASPAPQSVPQQVEQKAVEAPAEEPAEEPEVEVLIEDQTPGEISLSNTVDAMKAETITGSDGKPKPKYPNAQKWKAQQIRHFYLAGYNADKIRAITAGKAIRPAISKLLFSSDEITKSLNARLSEFEAVVTAKSPLIKKERQSFAEKSAKLVKWTPEKIAAADEDTKEVILGLQETLAEKQASIDALDAEIKNAQKSAEIIKNELKKQKVTPGDFLESIAMLFGVEPIDLIAQAEILGTPWPAEAITAILPDDRIKLMLAAVAENTH